jgi:hypothetical protein
MKEPNQNQIELIEFISAIIPGNWRLFTEWDDFKFYEVKRFYPDKTMVIFLFFKETTNGKKLKYPGEVYGPEKVLENVSVARINLYPHRKDQNWLATALHCLAHIKAEGDLSFRNRLIKMKYFTDIEQDKYRRTNHGLLFQYALDELFKEVNSRLRGDISPSLISAVHAELKQYRSLKIIVKGEKPDGIPWLEERKTKAIIRFF